MKIIKIGAIWCPGCLVMKKTWKSIFEQYPNLNLIELDMDMNSEEVTKYNPGKVLPVIIFLDDNDNEKERLIGEQKEKDLISVIEKYK